MRIVHTSLRYPPATGGVEHFVQQLVERTRNIPDVSKQSVEEISPKNTWRDVRVITSKLRTHHPATELSPEDLKEDAAYVQRLHHSTTPVIAYPRLQALPYYLSHHNPNIIHAHGFWYQPADVSARFAKKHKTPLILHPYYYENEVRNKPIWQLYKNTIGKKTFADADVVAVISPYEQELIEKAGFPVKRFELIPPGIDTDEFNQPKENPFTTLNISGNILLTVSRLASGKGIDDVIQALPQIHKSHPDTHLVVVGEDFGAKKELEKQINELGLNKKVHLVGKLDREKLIGAFQNATLFIHPSHYEAFGIVVGEALAAKTAVVARNSTAIPFVAPHEKASLLFNNQTELVDHVTTLLEHPEQRETLANQGHSHVQEHFNWNHTIKKLEELYTEFAQ